MLKFSAYLAAAVSLLLLLLVDLGGGTASIIIAAGLSVCTIAVIRRRTDDANFLVPVFLGALSVRLILGVILHVFELREFMGSDAIGYDLNANRIVDYWMGLVPQTGIVDRLTSMRGAGWGMQYLVSVIYVLTDRSILAAQSFCAVIGAATVPAAYVCVRAIFGNRSSARATALLIAFFPSMIIWSGQLLKDGLIGFLLVVAVTAVVSLQKKFSWTAIAILASSMFGVLSLRFYVFYFIAATVALTFLAGMTGSITSLFQRVAILGILIIVLLYVGVFNIASKDVEAYGSLERVQMSRRDLSHAQSGYGSDQNVSTVGGALSALPIGFVYLMFAPFPWEMSNVRQSITLPDVVLWWASIPLMLFGLVYTARRRLGAALPILVFPFLLTLAYSMFQGNVGTAYRQRTQIQVFLFMFVGVGIALYRERNEDRDLIRLANRRKMIERAS